MKTSARIRDSSSEFDLVPGERRQNPAERLDKIAEESDGGSGNDNEDERREKKSKEGL